MTDESINSLLIIIGVVMGFIMNFLIVSNMWEAFINKEQFPKLVNDYNACIQSNMDYEFVKNNIYCVNNN